MKVGKPKRVIVVPKPPLVPDHPPEPDLEPVPATKPERVPA